MTKKNPTDRVPAASTSTSGSNKAYFSLLFLATVPPLCIITSFCVGRHYGEDWQLQMRLKYPPSRFNFVPHSATERNTSFKEDEWKSIDFNESDDSDDSDDSEDTDETDQGSAGQHFMMDFGSPYPDEREIQLAPQGFEVAAEQLLPAIVQIFPFSTKLTYRCYEAEKVSRCLGYFPKGRITLYYWPGTGGMTLDIVLNVPASAVPRSLIPRVQSVVQSLTGTDSNQQDLAMRWSQQRRGMRSQSEKFNPEDIDLYFSLLSQRSRKDKTWINTVETKFQEMQLYDVLDHKKYPHVVGAADKREQEYMKKNPLLFRHDRVLYLDNIMQSRLLGEAAYHEALVHPGLFLHPNPKRVAIIGGGEGATLREVLKHDTVEKVIMIEIDEEMVQASREFLPEWSSCAGLSGSADSCFDDPRSEIYFRDAIAWFISRYLKEDDLNDEDLLDIIIMDALDPSSSVSFSDMLYNNTDFAKSIYNALNGTGILIAQMGEADIFNDVPDTHSPDQQGVAFDNVLQAVGFKNKIAYNEDHCGFSAPWSFELFLPDRDMLKKWFISEAEIHAAIAKRSRPATDGGLPFRYFDGATFMTYQFPSRIEEEFFCREDQNSSTQFQFFPKKVVCEKQYQDENDANN